MTKIIKQIVSHNAQLYSKPNENSELETECLFGELFSVYKNFNNWTFGILSTDNYLGWIKTSNLGDVTLASHVVISKSTNIQKTSNIKSKVIKSLSLGSKVRIIDFEKTWSVIEFVINTKKTIGFIPSNHLSKISNFDHDWEKIGFQMLNTPYKWGGRTNQGLDCSALLQLSFQTIGINLPRNTSEQICFMHNSKNFENIKIDQDKILCLKKGTIIFWDGHVGFMSTSKNLLHANAFHMKVEQEPVVETIKRFENDETFVTSFFTFNY